MNVNLKRLSKQLPVLTAMQTELKLMKEQNVWTVVIPSKRNLVDCKWVYKIKKDSAGQISRYKARKGFHSNQALILTSYFH